MAVPRALPPAPPALRLPGPDGRRCCRHRPAPASRRRRPRPPSARSRSERQTPPTRSGDDLECFSYPMSVGGGPPPGPRIVSRPAGQSPTRLEVVLLKLSRSELTNLSVESLPL